MRPRSSPAHQITMPTHYRMTLSGLHVHEDDNSSSVSTNQDASYAISSAVSIPPTRESNSAPLANESPPETVIRAFDGGKYKIPCKPRQNPNRLKTNVNAFRMCLTQMEKVLEREDTDAQYHSDLGLLLQYNTSAAQHSHGHDLDVPNSEGIQSSRSACLGSASSKG